MPHKVKALLAGVHFCGRKFAIQGYLRFACTCLFFRRGITIRNHVLGATDKIFPRIRLAGLKTCLMPGLSFFTASTNVGYGIQPVRMIQRKTVRFQAVSIQQSVHTFR